MTDFLIYNLKAGFILSVLYVLYVVLLRKETYYSFNRTYLIGALVISFLLPALNISLAPSQSPVQNSFVYIEHAFHEVSQTLEYVEMETANNVSSFPIIPFLLLCGMIIAALRVGFQLIRIYINIKKYDIKKRGKFTYVLMDKYMTTHSFFNYIFVQKSDLSDRQRKNVLLHEQFHADRWHSFDLLLVGFLSILQWFNPFIYLTKRALSETHEFQADQAVVDRGVDKLHYQQLLLAQSRSIVFAGLTSKFNQSLIKNRLKMMNRIKSKNSAVIKYLLVVPVIFVISIVFAVSQKKIDNSITGVMAYNSNDVSVDPFGFVDFNIQLEEFVKSDSSDYIPSISPVEEKFLEIPVIGYGMRMHPILKYRRMHAGADFVAPLGTPIKATASGKILIAKFYKTSGNMLKIDHGNTYVTKYFHLSKFVVSEGQEVKKGEVIGYVGNTGLSKRPHVHYEIWKDNKHIDPLDYLEKSFENIEESMG